MHCWLQIGDQALMGADMDIASAPNIDTPKNGFDVTLHADSVEEARRWFSAGLEAGCNVKLAELLAPACGPRQAVARIIRRSSWFFPSG